MSKNGQVCDAAPGRGGVVTGSLITEPRLFLSLHLYFFFQIECGGSDVCNAHQLCSEALGNPLKAPSEVQRDCSWCCLFNAACRGSMQWDRVLLSCWGSTRLLVGEEQKLRLMPGIATLAHAQPTGNVCVLFCELPDVGLPVCLTTDHSFLSQLLLWAVCVMHLEAVDSALPPSWI